MNRKKLFRNFFILSAFLCLSGVIIAQQYNMSNPIVMQKVNTELQKRGLTENEVRARLLQEGINIDALTPSDAPQYQNRIVAILDKMQAEKKAGSNSFGTAADSLIQMPQADTLALQLKSPEKPKAAETVVSNIYGHSVFADNSFDLLTSLDGSQAPDTYVLGEGDEIHITIFGASQTDIQQRINAQGAIQPVGVAKIFLKGLTLSQARELIKRQLSSAYLFREDQIAVTLVKVRTILVNVFGEVKKSGGFSISALNSALNALSVAGGPAEIGTVRNIQLIRGNTRKTIDLYAFMTDPTVRQKFDLQNNDIIFVPVAQKIVTVEGAVKRPMQYEVSDNETLSDLIQFAGGLMNNTYPEIIQIQRFDNGEVKLMELSLKDVLNGKNKTTLVNGDIVTLKSINKPLEQFVEISGSVYYPGKYDLSSNSTLSAIIKKAQPTYYAKKDMVFIERTRPDSTIEVLSASFPGNGIPDVSLQGRDKVRIMDLSSYRDLDTIAVNGQVRQPFKKYFNQNDRLTIKQAVELAGGLLTTAYPVAYIFRKNLLNPVEMKYIRVDLLKQQDMQLQPGDQLNIYDNTTYTNQGNLEISGAVKNPGKYVFDASLSVHDLIANAGGFNLGAAFDKVQVFRANLSSTEKVKFRMITLTVDSSYQVVMPLNFQLQPYDKVVVRMIPDFTTGRTVEVNGEVSFPGQYIINKNETRLSDIVKMAGGLLRTADPYGSTLFRTYRNRGEVSVNVHQAMAHPGDYSENPVVFEGDVFNINRMENTVAILGKATGLVNYVIDTTSVGPGKSMYQALDSLEFPTKNVVFRGYKPANWYIKEFAGGFNKQANRNSVTVTYPNNEMHATRHFLFFRVSPRVVPGSTIAVQLDGDKIQKVAKPVEHQDLETTISKALSILTSTISIVILAQRL